MEFDAMNGMAAQSAKKMETLNLKVVFLSTFWVSCRIYNLEQLVWISQQLVSTYLVARRH